MMFEQFLQKVDNTFTEHQMARMMFKEHFRPPNNDNNWRLGQTIMNVLYEIWPEKYNEIKGTDIDCFYDNGIIRLTLEKLEQDWKHK